MSLRDIEQCALKQLYVIRGKSQFRAKHSGFVSATWMLVRKAVVAELDEIHNGISDLAPCSHGF